MVKPEKPHLLGIPPMRIVGGPACAARIARLTAMMHSNTFNKMEIGHVVIGRAEDERLTIKVVSREADDWRVAHVEVACGIWRGAFRWNFYKGELRQFGYEVEQLYRTLSGSASLVAMEPNLTLKMTGDGKGHVTVEGRAEPEFYTNTYLAFGFALDQTDLPAIVSALLASDPA